MVAKKIKNLKWIGPFLLLSILSGCLHTLNINGKRCFLISYENVEIKVRAKSDMRFFYALTIKSRKGSIEIHPNKLRLTSIPLADTIRVDGVYYKNKAKTQSFMLSQGETVECKFSVYPNMQTRFMMNEIYLLPGDFITHQGVSLINDTIKMRVFPLDASF